MVRVPEYIRNVETRPGFRQDLDVRATPEAFGASVGRGMQQAGQGLTNFGEAMARVQEIDDLNRAKEADNNYATWMRGRMYGEGGFMTLEGRSAVDGFADFQREAEEKRKEFGKGLPAGATRSYHDASQARATSALQQSIVHTMNARKQWFKDASSARLDTFAEDALASFNVPAIVEKNIAAGQAEIRQQAGMLGWDADTTKNREAEYISGVRLNVALRTMGTDPVAAQKYFDEHKQALTGPHQLQFEQAVKVPLVKEKVKRHTDEFFQSTANPTPREAAQVVRGFEGFRTTPYWDVNAYRVGYGSDTITKADGTVVRVQPGMTVTQADAERDLQRRLNDEFVPGIVRDVGAEAWSKLPASAQAGLTSVAYNYGRLPFRVANAVIGGDLGKIAQEVDALRSHNNGVNANRRAQEADIIRGFAGVPAATAAALPQFTAVEKYLSGITDFDERELTRKAIYAQIDARAKAAKEAQVANVAKAFNLIETQNISPFQLPAEVTTAVGMEGMSNLMTYWEKRSKGRQPDTDDRVLHDLQSKYATDPAAFAQLDLFKYRNQLDDQDWKAVNSWRQTALTDQRKAKEEGLTLSRAFSQATQQLEAVGIAETGKEGSARQKAAAQIAQFQNALASEMEAFKRNNNNRDPGQLEIQSMVNKLLLPVVVKTPGFVWNNNEDRRLFEIGNRPDNATVDVNVQYTDIPIDLRRGIAIDLERELGRKPSEREVIHRYEDFILERGQTPIPLPDHGPVDRMMRTAFEGVAQVLVGVPARAALGAMEWFENGGDRGREGTR